MEQIGEKKLELNSLRACFHDLIQFIEIKKSENISLYVYSSPTLFKFHLEISHPSFQHLLYYTYTGSICSKNYSPSVFAINLTFLLAPFNIHGNLGL